MYITYTATPAATTIAIASACPFIASRSRNSLRLSGWIFMSPVEIARRELLTSIFHRDHPPVSQANHPIRHRRNRRVVGDHHGRGSHLGVDALERFENDDSGRDIERARRFVAEQHGRPFSDGARDRHSLLFAAGELSGEMFLTFAQIHELQG